MESQAYIFKLQFLIPRANKLFSVLGLLAYRLHNNAKRGHGPLKRVDGVLVAQY